VFGEPVNILHDLEKLLTPDQLHEAHAYVGRNGGSIRQAIVRLGFVKDEDITSVLSRQYGLLSIDLGHCDVDPAIIKIIPAEIARDYLVLPLWYSGAILTVAMAYPSTFVMDHIKFVTGYNVEPVLASESALGVAVHRYYGTADGQADCLTVNQFISEGKMSVRDSPAGLGIGPPHSPPVQLVSLILWDAICCGASQILVEPRRKIGWVSYRLEGRLEKAGRFPGAVYDSFTNRLRLMCGLSLDDPRQVQEGSFSITATNQRGPVYVPPTRWTFAFAVSIIPAGDSHKVVLNCAKSDGEPAPLPPPGFSDHALFETTGSFRLRKVSLNTSRPTRG